MTPNSNLPKIDSHDVEPFKHNHQVFRANIPCEMKSEDLIVPEVWSNVLAGNGSIRTGDIIECVKQDYSAFIELLVVGRERKGLLVEIIREVDFCKKATGSNNSEESYEIKWCGPNKKFAILRESDKEELMSGIPSKPEAEAAIETKSWLS